MFSTLPLEVAVRYTGLPPRGGVERGAGALSVDEDVICPEASPLPAAADPL